MDALGPLDRRHNSKTEETTVSEDQWSFERSIETDLDVPEPLLRETRSRRKCFYALAMRLERLALYEDRHAAGAYLCVA
jgi:hypothetical protein